MTFLKLATMEHIKWKFYFREHRAAMSLDLSTYGEMVHREEELVAETSLTRDNRAQVREARKWVGFEVWYVLPCLKPPRSQINWNNLNSFPLSDTQYQLGRTPRRHRICSGKLAVLCQYTYGAVYNSELKSKWTPRRSSVWPPPHIACNLLLIFLHKSVHILK